MVIGEDCTKSPTHGYTHFCLEAMIDRIMQYILMLASTRRMSGANQAELDGLHRELLAYAQNPAGPTPANGLYWMFLPDHARIIQDKYTREVVEMLADEIEGGHIDLLSLSSEGKAKSRRSQVDTWVCEAFSSSAMSVCVQPSPW